MASTVTTSEIPSVVLPYSEVCMHLRVAGRRMRYALHPSPGGGEPAVQLLDDDGRRFSFPITLGEAGLYRDGQGQICPALPSDEQEGGGR